MRPDLTFEPIGSASRVGTRSVIQHLKRNIHVTLAQDLCRFAVVGVSCCSSSAGRLRRVESSCRRDGSSCADITSFIGGIFSRALCAPNATTGGERWNPLEHQKIPRGTSRAVRRIHPVRLHPSARSEFRWRALLDWEGAFVGASFVPIESNLPLRVHRRATRCCPCVVQPRAALRCAPVRFTFGTPRCCRY